MSESAVMNDFCRQLKQIIESTGLPVCTAARQAGFDPSDLSRILNGKQGVTLERAERLANMFGATLCIKVKKRKKTSAA